MRYRIKHESRGRIRIELKLKRMTLREADTLEAWLLMQKNIERASVHERTCCAVISYKGERERVLELLNDFDLKSSVGKVNTDSCGDRLLRREYEEKLVNMVAMRAVRAVVFPPAVKAAWHTLRAVPYVMRGLRCVFGRKMQVEILDGLSIGISIIRGDHRTAGSVMFLLRLGELLEEWTHKKSASDLARSMSLNIDRVWLCTENGEVLVPIGKIRENDRVVVRMGGIIPFDGTIEDGEVSINEASLTGEPVPKAKGPGATVYAGTVLEEGECRIKVARLRGESRYDKIVAMIEQSEKLKSAAEDRAIGMADRLVPYTLIGSGLVYFFTKNTIRALSVLMVDFSCALKLSIPLSVLSAMREAGDNHILVKGGKYLEAVSNADTIVFDKTGTLTHAKPKVADVIAFGDNDAAEMLRLAACLEEHFPHSMANAVVEEAGSRGLKHEEMHSKVEYVVAHGIVSSVEDKRVIIGSRHFVFDDEKCTLCSGDEEKFESLPDKYSHLYMAVGGKLAAVICIFDPLKEEAGATLKKLRGLGINKTVMLTGDSEKTAAAIAAEVGVDDYLSEVLPEDKASYIGRERAEGRRVIMVGDGINDSPALSAANVGIAVSDGAAIAREVADITIAEDDLNSLVTLRRLSMALAKRVDNNYRFILSFNGMLIGLGAFGMAMPQTLALLHNLSTLAISLKSMTTLLQTNSDA